MKEQRAKSQEQLTCSLRAQFNNYKNVGECRCHIRSLLFALCSLSFVFCTNTAEALENNYGKWNFNLSGYGMAGGVQTDEDSGIMNDWQVRAQASYRKSDNWLFGAVVSHSAWNLDREDPFMDAFGYTQTPWGRLELGWTDSIATKLGLGLPDVGGMRIGRDPLVYDFANPSPMISETIISDTSSALRANVVSVPGPIQFGFSFAPKNQHFDSATDFGIKYKKAAGKTKMALSLGASFIDNPDNLIGEIYAPRTTADWRGAVSTGMNLQYNSWIWGVSAKAVYDQNPIGALSDGLAFGTGVSYDFLKWSASASYMLSQVGVFHDESDYFANTGIVSIRYKIDQFWNVWTSGGIVSAKHTSPFISAGLMLKF